MVALGYNRLHAEKAVRLAMKESPAVEWSTDKLLRTALKFMQA
jgi:Holliday junction resolvasome RuvABC DNA-binding subunit